MYERFTDRARKVMQLANQEALRFNHESIGSELMLLGLCKLASCGETNIFFQLGVHRKAVQLAVETVVQSGPEVITTDELPVTPLVRSAITQANSEAGFHLTEPEHLLVGLMLEEECLACRVLTGLGITLARVREALQDSEAGAVTVDYLEQEFEGPSIDACIIELLKWYASNLPLQLLRVATVTSPEGPHCIVLFYKNS